MKTETFLFFFSLSILIISCTKTTKQNKTISAYKNTSMIEETTPLPKKNDSYYHYSIWWAFVNKVFDADLSVEKLKKNGDIGLGSFNKLDGEMVMVDGIPYRIREDGSVSEGKDSDTIVYANAAFFEKNDFFELKTNELDLITLQSQLLQKISSPNFFYVFKIKGKLDYIKCGGLTKQEPPFNKGLDILIPNRPVFEGSHISGTLVGFYCPDFIGNINVKGFHFHFISDDKKLGGHVMEFKTSDNLSIEVDKKSAYHFELPDNQYFKNVSM